MSPSSVNKHGHMVNGVNGVNGHVVDTMNPHDQVHFDPALRPRRHEIKGTDPNSRILIQDVNIIDSTGQAPFRGDVYIEGERIKDVGTVPNRDHLRTDPNVRCVEGRGRYFMSGLGDAHTHFTWNNGDLGRLGELGVEEHTLLTAKSAQCYLDSGYTMCYGAASAKERLDCVIRDAINNGDLPGPRYLANGKEMAVPDGDLVPGITAFAKGPLEMRETIRHHIKLGVDNIKLSMSGEQICETRDAQDCYYTDEETAACVDEAHRNGIRLCAHARARDSVKMCVKHGVDIIYHASWTDDEGMDMLEKNKHKHMVAPGINWLVNTIYQASAFGYSFEKAEQVGYKKELDHATKVLKEMHQRGITVLPGGDYGFAWTLHGTYARDLEHFVKLLEFTPMESIVAATAGIARLFMREDELGKILPGYYADCILVDGNPLEDITVLQDHDKLNMILINGRIHKASYKEFVKFEQPSPVMEPRIEKMQNFVAYALKDGTGRTRVGHWNHDKNTITPVSFLSGTPIENIYQVLPLGEDGVIAGGEPFQVSESVTILPPIGGRDVLAVGKNYSEHAKEFNASGYDASDKVDLPSHPVIFTKRATSIIAHNDDILLHKDFTETPDYEGEIGVIVGKGGFKISEADAQKHVWGYTIINDVTAREKQRDHKQFYIGKSADTFCPMGPLAVPASVLPKVLKVTTHVNGEKRQEGTTEDLIFSIPKLIATLSESQTLRPGDVIATGTPAGVGFGLNPPTFLKSGDVVEISVTGLGTLRNKVAAAEAPNYTSERLTTTESSEPPINNLSLTMGGLDLTILPSGKRLNTKTYGKGPNLLIFVHGLGGNLSYFTPLLHSLGLNKDDHTTYTSLLYDIEGHGMSPTSASSKITIQSLASDLDELLTQNPSLSLPLSNITLITHSLSCLPALHLLSTHFPPTTPTRTPSPLKFQNLILLGPPPTPIPTSISTALLTRASTARNHGMRTLAPTISAGATSAKTQNSNSLAFAAVQMSLLSTDPEGYSKGCSAMAGATDLEVDFAQIRENVAGKRVVVTGDEDKVCSVKWAQELSGKGKLEGECVVLRETGHWGVFEDGEGTERVVRSVLGL